MKFFCAILDFWMGGVFGYCGVIGYREPVLDSLWQKWGFHARLVANAVLLIWLASKNLEGARSPPEPLPSSPPASPARLGSLPTFSGLYPMSEHNNASGLHSLSPPVRSLLLIQQNSIHAAAHRFWTGSTIKITPPLPLLSQHSFFLSSGMWIVDPSLSLPRFI